MTVPVAVLSAGVGLPDLRVDAADIAGAWGERGRGTVGACAGDQDTLTLAWSAADAALGAASRDAAEIDGLWWGTTRTPWAEGPSHATLAAALGLSRHSIGALTCGSAHSGMEALLGAWDAVLAGSVRTALVVCSDALVPGTGTTAERHVGAAGVALVLSAGEGPATLTGRATRTEPFLDRWRGTDETSTRDVYDARLFREQTFLPHVTEVATALGSGGGVTAWSLPDPDRRLGDAVAKRLGLSRADVPVTTALGDTGAAAALLGAVPGMGERGVVAAIGHGGGRTSGVTISLTGPLPGADAVDALLATGRTATYPELLRARDQLVARGETVPMGVPPGSAMFVRGARELLELLGARCVDCGVISTPPSVHPHCSGCGGDKLEDVRLARAGSLQTFAVNHAMPAPFVAPLPLAVLDLDDGARVMLQVVGDGADLAIGARVRLVLRRYAVERGSPVYGWKAASI